MKLPVYLGVRVAETPEKGRQKGRGRHKMQKKPKNLRKTKLPATFSLYFVSRVPYDCNDSRGQEALRRPVNKGVQDIPSARKYVTGGFMATQRMTQTALVRALAEKNEVSNKQARAILDHLSELAVSEVKKNGVFVMPGIGRLVRVDRKARMGRNPATGAQIKIPAKKVVKFRVAKAAKDAIVPPKKPKA